MRNSTHYSEMELLFFLGLCMPGGFDSLYPHLNKKYEGSFEISDAVIDLVQNIESLMMLHKEWNNGEFFEDMMTGAPWVLDYVRKHKDLPTAEQFRAHVRLGSTEEIILI